MIQNESGRSMVEMLGVLAIIGVLSIGGIQGYTLAMNRFRANGALAAASAYGILVYTGYQTHIVMGKSGAYQMPAIPSGFSFEGVSFGTPRLNVNVTGADDSVEIDIYFDKEKVCQAAGATLGETCEATNTPSGEKYMVTYTQKQT